MFYDMCIHPDYQKKNIGTLLMDHLINKIKDKEYISIGLFTSEGNKTLAQEIENDDLICAGVVADIFSGLHDALEQVRNEFVSRGICKIKNDFIPISSSLLVTYFGNCLGNNYQDQETEFFSMIQSIFQNRPLEILTG
ncbi:MAG TPA: GNAT family N-acetyltransferase, partial [Gammaproteobacteria bacterium]|nr:GNAT family N-acetyltransferase [Gammaproteobacteria bacterium]